MKTKICRMTEQSAKRVAQIEAQCFSSPWPLESFLRILGNKNAVYYTALCGDEVAGYIGMFNLIDELSIINIAIDPLYRRCKIASQLLERALDYAISIKCPKITLEVRESNIPAVNLYTHNGYVRYGKEPNYYSNPREDAILFCKAIGES